jgi:hypothetical protein
MFIINWSYDPVCLMLWSVTLLQIGLILVSLLIYYCFPFLIQHEAQLVDDGTALSGFQQVSSRYGSSDDDYADSDDTTTEQPYYRPPVLHPRYSDNKLSVIPTLRIKRERELKRRPQNNGWAFKRVLLSSCHRLFSLTSHESWAKIGSKQFFAATYWHLQKQQDSF